jgi:hypothetical protein
MRRTLLLSSLAALAFALPVTACATAAPAVTPAVHLTVKVDLGIGVWEQWTLNSAPTAGTHPNRKAACQALLAAAGRTLLAPVPAGIACSMIYGGPERALVAGTWNGKRITAAFSRVNGCQIARWDKAKALFTVPGKSIVRGTVSLSPTCAVQQVGQTCEDPSVKATVTFTRGSLVFKTLAIAGKGFALRLANGNWIATADAGMSCPKVALVVPAMQPLVIGCDTGIR